jgi:hypothetical protein
MQLGARRKYYKSIVLHLGMLIQPTRTLMRITDISISFNGGTRWMIRLPRPFYEP